MPDEYGAAATSNKNAGPCRLRALHGSSMRRYNTGQTMHDNDGHEYRNKEPISSWHTRLITLSCGLDTDRISRCVVARCIGCVELWVRRVGRPVSGPTHRTRGTWGRSGGGWGGYCPFSL